MASGKHDQPSNAPLGPEKRLLEASASRTDPGGFSIGPSTSNTDPGAPPIVGVDSYDSADDALEQIAQRKRPRSLEPGRAYQAPPHAPVVGHDTMPPEENVLVAGAPDPGAHRAPTVRLPRTQAAPPIAIDSVPVEIPRRRRGVLAILLAVGVAIVTAAVIWLLLPGQGASETLGSSASTGPVARSSPSGHPAGSASPAPLPSVSALATAVATASAVAPAPPPPRPSAVVVTTAPAPIKAATRQSTPPAPHTTAPPSNEGPPTRIKLLGENH